MGFTEAQYRTEFLVELGEFGEEVTIYVDGGSSGRAIQALIPRGNISSVGLQSTTYGPGKEHRQVVISQDPAIGSTTIQKGVTKVKYRVEQDDVNMKTLTVQSATQKYGAWYLGFV